MRHGAKHVLLIVGLSGTGILSLGVVPPEELEATKPQLQVNQSGNNLIIDWEAHPEVFYFMEGTPELTSETPWVTAKLLKDNDASGSLSLGTAVSGSKAFYRLSLEGDSGAARLREDSDGDGIINLLEAEAGWDAYATEASTDSDSDGIPDYFEQFHFGTLEHDANYVAVTGGLTLAEAYANATDPNATDSDGDGFTDAYEIANGLDPNYNQSRDNKNLDTDGDGLTDWLESRRGTNPLLEDSDNDGKNDTEDAVGYDAFFTFDATNEGTFVVIDRGALDENDKIMSINNRGTIAIKENDQASIKQIPLFGDTETYEGEFIDLNNQDQLLRRVSDTPPDLIKTYIDQTLWFEDIHGSTYRVAYSITDEGKLHHERQHYKYHSMSDDLYIQSRALFINDVQHALGNVASAVTTAINSISDETGNETAYYSTLNDALILSISSAEASVAGQKLYAREFGAFSHNGDYGIAAHLIEGDLGTIGGSFDLEFDGHQFSDGTYIEAVEGELQGIARITGQQGLWKIWYDLTLDQQVLSLSGPSTGQPLREGGINQQQILHGKIAENGLTIANGNVWQNGRLLSREELIGTNSEWTNINLSKIADSGNFIVGTAEKNEETRAVLLLKMDIDLHQPGKLVGRTPIVDPVQGITGYDYTLPPEISEDEQQTPSRCPILINDDNDDLDSIISGSSVVSPYPQDNDDSVLKLREPTGGNTALDDDDVVMVTLRQFDGVNTGKIRLTTSSNSDVRFFKYEEGQYTLNAVDMADLVVDLSNPGTTSPLKDLPNEDVSFYVEGINANSDLAVQMIFEDANDNELARQEVHLEIVPTRIISLSAQGNGELAEITVQSTLTNLMQGANIVRRDRDGLDANADVSVPVTFRVGIYRGMDNDPSHINWKTTSSGSPEAGDILDYASANGIDIYVIQQMTYSGSGGFARSGGGCMVIPSQGAPDRVIAHEWLHAFGDTIETIDDANDDGHICIDQHLMEGSGCSDSLSPGSDVRESEKILFQIY